jgi:hypothetical protein
MVISTVYLTPLDEKVDLMAWKAKEFRWMTYRCE